MNLFTLVVTTLLLSSGCQGQYKNTGIKTRYPAQTADNLILSTVNSNQQNVYPQQQEQFDTAQTSGNVYDRYGGNFKPAQYYHDGNTSAPAVTRSPVILDPTAEFINKTRASMASGVCFREVPTASLHHGSGMVPAGNGSQPGMSKIQVCCEGYERNPHVFLRCDPICIDDCPNGICTAPNTCVCIPGHVRNDQGKCVTTCPIGCANGLCGNNNECFCKPGYALEPVHQKYCEPICETGCQFGKCVAPNKCDCQEGYRFTTSGMCEPKCDHCENGRCTSPGYCSCNEGYIKIDALCEPICTRGCENGHCIAPDSCSCAEFLELDHTGSKCVPHCSPPCLNGVCAANNKCICDAGYVADETQPNLCKPHCSQECPNGYCSSPNFCACNPGFIKKGIKGRHTCTPA